ncbi:MAG: hypothetical protein M3P04_13845 [Actinomycetota bacterium]|nr:hypothetical protein [Actinomycetota bacterium]
MPSRRTALLAACALVTGGAVATVPARAATTPARFSTPMLLAGGGAEPSIRVPNDGLSAAYVSAPTGLGSNFWRITEQRNKDKSISFVQSPVPQPDLGTGGGDSEISVGTSPAGESRCDTIAYSGLHNIDLLDNFTVAQSTDCGKTFSLANPYGTQNTLTDRQWQAFDGAKTNFLIYHKVDTSQIVVSESIDGGLTYVSLSPDGAHGIVDAKTLPAAANTNQVGNIAVDMSHPTGSTNLLSGEPVHRMYAVFGAPRDAADNAQAQIDGNAQGAGAYNHVDTIYLARSDDGGITWVDTKVYGVDPASKRELNMLFPVVGVDKAGIVYVVWSDGFKVEYAASNDGGKHFTKPRQVNHGNRGLVKGTGANKPDAAKSDLFPWIAAGASGLLDVVWYHGEGGARDSNLAYRDPGDKNTKWTVAFAQIGKAASKKPRELSYSEAVTPITHRGDICQNGTFCGLVPVPGAPFSKGDRSLLDFFEVAIDKDGRANIALADNADAPGALQTAYIRQTSGYSLTTGKKLVAQVVRPPKIACNVDAGFSDPAGDANAVALATPLPNQPALDITRAWVSFDNKALVLHTRVLDLAQDPPTGATGIDIEFSFTYNGVGYVASGSHNSGTGADSFDLQSPRSTAVGGPMKGAFDKAHDEIRIVIPAGTFKAIGKGPVMSKGAKVTGLSLNTRRGYPAVLSPVADSAGSPGCPFVVGASSRGTTIPAAVDNRPLPSLGDSALPTGLALIAFGLLMVIATGIRRTPVLGLSTA